MWKIWVCGWRRLRTEAGNFLLVFRVFLILDTGVRALNGPDAPLPGRLDTIRRPWPVRSVGGEGVGNRYSCFLICIREKSR